MVKYWQLRKINTPNKTPLDITQDHEWPQDDPESWINKASWKWLSMTCTMWKLNPVDIWTREKPN